ncbi:hypothetical protein Slin14017_G109700 [Septoria linicola]|nr:hypothetical protein Slin14017_G109700 [Septoria linicola]
MSHHLHTREKSSADYQAVHFQRTATKIKIQIRVHSSHELAQERVRDLDMAREESTVDNSSDSSSRKEKISQATTSSTPNSAVYSPASSTLSGHSTWSKGSNGKIPLQALRSAIVQFLADRREIVYQIAQLCSKIRHSLSGHDVLRHMNDVEGAGRSNWRVWRS